MFLGLTPFTLFHVVITLVAIVSGLLVLFGFLGGRDHKMLTHIFLLFTLATSVTGFLFPIHGFTPALGTGIVSMIVLIPALAGYYAFHLAGNWRWVYVVGAVIALYLNCFVLVVQSFLKVPALHALAPNGSEPVFAIAQGAVLLFFVITGTLAARRFYPV